jgi:hypothetical protein
VSRPSCAAWGSRRCARIGRSRERPQMSTADR